MTPITDCAACDRPLAAARVLSAHHTSEGWVRYRRCACGHVSIELVSVGEPALVLA